MSFQQTPMKVETDDGHNFTLLQPYNYQTNAGELITIPAGTTTDGASVPQAMWNILPPFGTYWKAAVLHDYLYRVTKRPKKECDSILKEAMESLGVNDLTLLTIYEGVAIGGDEAFEEDRKEQH
jgi:hypothetical protein